MLTLNDGRSELWQWDTGRTLAVDADCSQVHFSNRIIGRSIDVDVINGVAIIPDILLQTDKDLNVWAFVGAAENGYTKISKIFKVNRRNKPADYVFTPQEQILLKDAIAIVETAKSAANDAIESAKQAEASAEKAAQAKKDALTSQSKAESAQSGAERAKNLAETAMGRAETAAVDAGQALSAAVQARDDAVQEADRAAAAANDASESESNAQTHASNAAQFAAQASTARDEAQQSANVAETALAVTNRSLDALWKLNQGITYEFQTDDAEAYQKTVPSGAKLANVNAIGGHTEVIDTELVSADVESVAERGRNLFDKTDNSKFINAYVNNGKIIGDITRVTVFIRCKGDTTYTITKIRQLENDRLSSSFSVDYPKVGVTVYGTKLAPPTDTPGNKMTITLTTGSDAKYLVVWAAWNSEKKSLDSLQIEESKNGTDYAPYRENIYKIPESVLSIPGYGWSAGEVCNSIERTETGWQYVQRVGSRDYQDGDTVTDGTTTYYELAKPIITDITEMMENALDAITVETGGTLTFENAAQLPVPNSAEYAVKLSEVIG